MTSNKGHKTHQGIKGAYKLEKSKVNRGSHIHQYYSTKSQLHQ